MDIPEITRRIKKISKIYTGKFGINPDTDWYILKLQEELGELIQIYLMLSGRARKKGKTTEEMKKLFDEEVADVLCHLLLLADHTKTDLDKTIKDKWLKWDK